MHRAARLFPPLLRSRDAGALCLRLSPSPGRKSERPPLPPQLRLEPRPSDARSPAGRPSSPADRRGALATRRDAGQPTAAPAPPPPSRARPRPAASLPPSYPLPPRSRARLSSAALGTALYRLAPLYGAPGAGQQGRGRGGGRSCACALAVGRRAGRGAATLRQRGEREAAA